MPIRVPLYHEVCHWVHCWAARGAVPEYSITRLALLVTGILAAQSCVLARVAREVESLGLTAASSAESVARRLRRTLNDPHLLPAVCYREALRAAIDWEQARRAGRLVLAVDDSSQDNRIHVLRVSLLYWGGGVPLAWALWGQNIPQAPGHSWEQMDRVLETVAALLPPG